MMKTATCLAAALALLATSLPAQDTLSEGDAILQALESEHSRSMELQMADLESPYFIQYNVLDVIGHSMSASYGVLEGSTANRRRLLMAAARIGSMELDNTNFAGDGGFFFFGGGGREGFALIPEEDNVTALRHALWATTDGLYKASVETLAKKRAYMEDKTFEDRADDFSAAPAVEDVRACIEWSFDPALWEHRIETLSARFADHARVQASSVSLEAVAADHYIVNSEGTRIRTGDGGLQLSVSARAQADDGMRVRDALRYVARRPEEFPTEEEMLADIDEMVQTMGHLMDASKLESYTGPVLFEGEAGAQVMREFLAAGVVGDADPVGEQRSSSASLEKKLGQRILPRSFQVYDDPTVSDVGETLLVGHYDYDHEGVAPHRVDAVVDGKLKALLMSRVPTKKLSGTTGHGRRAMPFGLPKATIGCLFIEDDDGVPAAELKQLLVEAAMDEGLEYGMKITALGGGGDGNPFGFSFAMFGGGGGEGSVDLPDPLYAYKVYVEDGREELIRGVKFGASNIRAAKRILAGGNEPFVHNGTLSGSSLAMSSVIAPSLLFEELELVKIQQELDKPPILDSPFVRAD